MGPFADACLGTLNDRDIAAYENLLSMPSPILMSWVMGETAPDPKYDTALLQSLRDFHLAKIKSDKASKTRP